MSPKTCLHCNEPMPADAWPTAKYCGKLCSGRAFNARRKEDGRLKAQREQLRDYRAAHQAANRDKYNTRPCAECGAQFTARGGGTLHCDACRARRVVEAATRRAARAEAHRAEVEARTQARLAARVWASGKCPRCGEWFTTEHDGVIYCTDRCRLAARTARRNALRGVFDVSPIIRATIYERDGWTCQLCGDPVDPELDPNDRMGATLDHIEPQSWALIPDHTDSNLRLAHRACNSRRGDALAA